MKNLFVIDDDQEMRELLRDVLVRQGYSVKTFSSAKVALENLTQRPRAVGPAAIICDVVMPDMDGREFLSHLKQMSLHIPIILITAFGSALSPKDAYSEGASRLLTKPFGISELIEAIKLVA